MTRPRKRKQIIQAMVKERERQRKIRKLQESQTMNIQQHDWESSEEEEDVTAIGLIQKGSDSESDESDDDEVIVSEGEEFEQANDSAFRKLMASAVEESRCVWPSNCSNTCSRTNYLVEKQVLEVQQF